MQLAILLPDLRSGGAERLHVNLASEWEKSGVTTEFVLRNAVGELLEYLPKTANVVDLKSTRVRGVLIPLIKYLKACKSDAIIAAMWPLTVIAPVAAKLARFEGQVIVSEHSPLSVAFKNKGLIYRVVMRLTQKIGYSLADVRIGVASGVADDLSKSSCIAREKFTVIHNPAALGEANFNAECPIPLKDRDGPIFLTVGTLKPVKRHDLLVEAFSKLPKSSNATLCILGEGQMRGQLNKLVDELGLHDIVLLPGFAANPAPWYAHSDVFVLSSDYEGFGNVIVEAMEYGLPIVSTDCPVGPREILDDGIYGRLVPIDDAEALAEAMFQVASKSNDPVPLQLRAREFSIEKIAKQYIDTIFGVVRC